MDEPKKINITTDEESLTSTPQDITLANIEAIDASDAPSTSVSTSTAPASSPAVAEAYTPVAAPVDEPAASPYVTSAHGMAAKQQSVPTKAKRFILAYLTTIFSALSLLGSVSVLGFVLAEHFIDLNANEDASLFYFDPAPFYISLMAGIITSATLYLVASRYVAKSANDDSIGIKDWRVYKVAYAIFAAGLFVFGASVIGSLLYIPLAQLLIADDLSSKEIQILVVGNIHILLWIGLLVWQERLVKHGKASWLQGTIVVIAALAIVVLTAIFPVGSKTDDRYDHRISTDLSAIETKIDTFKSDNKDELPASLTALDFGDEPITGRLAKYTYTVKEAEKPKSTSISSSSLMKQLSSQQAKSSSNSDVALLDEDSFDSLYGVTSREATEKKTYEICATFKTDTSSKKGSGGLLDGLAALGASSSSLKGNTDPFTKHKTGNICFTRE